MNENQKTGKRSGFTLIEVLMAMAVFSIGFLALASMQITATNGNTNARALMDAVSVLEDHMEYLKNVPNTTEFMDRTNGGNPHPDLTPTGPNDPPHMLEVDETVSQTVGDGRSLAVYSGVQRHFDGTLFWNVYNLANPDPTDGTPDATYPPRAIKIVVRLEWRNLMQERQLEYTFVRIPDIM